MSVLHFSQFDPSAAERSCFLADLGAAARDVGFFYLVGHGIAGSRAADISNAARQFFALSEREKLGIEMVNSPHFRGYTRVGRELTRGLPDD